MSISFNRYVNITSGIGAGAIVPRRNLVARFFTSNPLIPPGQFVQFTNANDVGTYFGTTSFEFQRAVFYFGWVSKNITKPQFIQFARWVNATSVPYILGYTGISQVLATYTAITAGTFGLNIGGVTQQIGPINFSGATSLSAVAALIQTAVQAAVSGNPNYNSATVTYNSAGTGSFTFLGGAPPTSETSPITITVTAGASGTDISAIMGWFPAATFTNGNIVPGAVWGNGVIAETTATTLTNSANVSNNFGSFAFMPPITLAQAITAAQWNEAQNVLYMFAVSVSAANASTWMTTNGTGLGLIGGTAATLTGPAGEFHEMCPMMILAATNYDAPNAVQNYEFQQFNLTPTVTTDALANTYDALNLNYYGATQDAGQQIAFYQTGVMTGLPTDPSDQNVYANEIWLKDAAGAILMTLLLGLNRISANDKGRGQIDSQLQVVVNQAVFNGTISIDKALTSTQEVYITEITNDPTAYYQVQTIGYWKNVVIAINPANGKYEATYTLVYSKDDIIRKINGTHVLI
jgi:hypothetical protein